MRVSIAGLMIVAGTLAALTAPAGQRSFLLDDFEKDLAATGAPWTLDFDHNNVGTRAEPVPFATSPGGAPTSTGRCARVSGHLGPAKEPWPFVNLGVLFSPTWQPTDLSAVSALRVQFRGNGQSVTVKIPRKTTQNGWNHFQTTIALATSGWTQVEIPLDAFAQPDWGPREDKHWKDALGLSFSPTTPDADFDFCIDDVVLVYDDAVPFPFAPPHPSDPEAKNPGAQDASLPAAAPAPGS